MTDELGGKQRRDKITAHYKKARDRALPVAERYRATARVNESFYGGEQWSNLTVTKGRATVNTSAWFDEEGVPRIYVNLYTGLCMTWTSLIVAGRPTVVAVAPTDTPESTYRAEVGQKAIEYVEGEVHSADKIQNTVNKGALGGTSGLKIVYVAAEEKIAWVPISVHDFLIDPNCGEDYKDARHVIFQDHCNKEEAERLYDEAGLKDQEPPEESYRNASGDELWGCPREEFWELPTKDFPKGIYACFIGEELVEEMDYPLLDKDDSGKEVFLLPLVLMKVRNQDGSVYGATNFTDVVPLQRSYNETVAREQLLIRKGSHTHLKVPEELAGFDPTKDTLIKFKQANWRAAEAIGYTTPPQIQPALAAQRDFFGQAMEAVVGLNSATTGRKQGSMSGRLVEHLVELDQNRNSDCTKSLQEMILDAYRLSLALMRRYFTVARQRKISGKETVDIVSFSGADLDGVDVRFQPASELDELQGAKEEDVAARSAAGLAGPTDVLKAKNSPTLGSSRMVAESLLKASLQGQPLSALPDDINYDVVGEVIAKHKSRALSQRDQSLWMKLNQFASQIKELQSRANNLNPAQPAAEPPPPGAPNAATT